MLTVDICTKDRYDALAHTIQSITQQTYLPQELIIFDDSQNKVDIRQISIYKNLLKLLDRKGIKWRVEFSPCHGQVKNHIKAIELCNTEYIYRCDDDHILQPNVLETLISIIQKNNNVGAVCNTILHPELEFPEDVTSTKMEDCLFYYAANFASFNGVKKVDHFYSSFLSKRDVVNGCYPIDLSNVGHREESICTYNIKKKGYDLLCVGNVYTWHMKESNGGIRSYNDPNLWKHDDMIFNKYLHENNIQLNNYYLMINAGGIGDNYAMRHILPKVREKQKNKKIILGTVYPNIYFDETNIDQIVSVHSANILSKGSQDNYNIYQWGWNKSWNKSIISAYKEIYGVL